MQLSRSDLKQHLRRIHTGGEITEAILGPRLGAAAITPDRSLAVDVPPAFDDEVIPEATGVVDLNVLIQALGLGTDPEIGFLAEDNRLVLDEGDEGVMRFMTADPSTITTELGDTEREEVLEEIGAGQSAALDRRTIEAVKGRQDLLGALEVHLESGPSGTTFVVGPRTGHFGTYQKPDLQTDGEEYTLILQANTLVRVFDLIEEPEEATLILTGPDSLVGVQFEDHTYVLNPMEEEE